MGHQDVSCITNPHRFSSENQPKNPDGTFRSGRKKGIPNFETVFKRYLKQLVDLKKKGEGEEVEIVRVTAQEAIVIKAIEQAIRTGDVRTVEMIMNRTNGLPTQAVKNLGKAPLQIMFTPKNSEELTNQENFETNINEESSEVSINPEENE